MFCFLMQNQPTTPNSHHDSDPIFTHWEPVMVSLNEQKEVMEEHWRINQHNQPHSEDKVMVTRPSETFQVQGDHFNIWLLYCSEE